MLNIDYKLETDFNDLIGILDTNKQKLLIYKQIKEYKDYINYNSFEDEYILYLTAFENLIRVMFDISSVSICFYNSYTKITTDYFHFIVSDGDIVIEVETSEQTYSDEFKQIYHELIRLESLMNKNPIINYDKTIRMMEYNIDTINKYIYMYFENVVSFNIVDLKRELKLKFIALL